ncbi:MAG: YitT family protein [Erysipelotrichaceae bacterium]|nr:YitT family protein [Erysipelotrichaceae bacterium]
MKVIDWRSFWVRFFISFLATMISELGIGCYYACGLGTDPISVFVDGLHGRFGLSYGTISTICNVIQAILIFLLIRKHLGPGTLLGVVIGGPLIDVFETLVRTAFPLESTSLYMRVVILIVGLITTGIGYGMGIGCQMGVGCFQFIPLFLNEYFHIDISYAQMISDGLFFIIGFILGGVVGVGTLAGVFLTGFILDKALDKTMAYCTKLGPWKA